MPLSASLRIPFIHVRQAFFEGHHIRMKLLHRDLGIDLGRSDVRVAKDTTDALNGIDLKKEKSFELWFEGCRYQDVMRWSKLDNDSYDKEAIEHLKVQGKHIPHLVDRVFRDPAKYDGDEDRVWQHSNDGSDPEDRFYLFHTHEAQDAGYQVGWQEKHRLFPYSQQVMDMNPNIKQNTGWE